MMRQYHEIKRQHPDKLLFFRLGDFYEMFYEDAVVGSRELEITLTSRHADRQGSPIPMCGVPYHAASSYLAKLVKKGYKVAICDQVEEPREARGIVRREVTRILTPGTAIEEGVLDSKEPNFTGAFVERGDRVGVGFLDLSTGQFWAAEFSASSGQSWLEGEWLHFRPSEIVLPESAPLPTSAPLQELEAVLTRQPDWTFNCDYGRRVLLEHFRLSTLEGLGLEGALAAVSAAGALLHYARQTQKRPLSHITSLRRLDPSRCLALDEDTVRNLELVRGLDGNRKSTLLAVLDRTRTAMGGRLLREWLLRPLLEREQIEARLDAIEELQGSIIARSRLAQLLESVHDLERLLSRVIMETATPRDLLALRDSLAVLPELEALLHEYSASLLRPQLDLLQDVVQRLQAALDEEAPSLWSDGGVIRSGYCAELDELRQISQSGKSFIAGLEKQERERTGIPSLKVRYNKVFGYFIEVTKTHLDSVPDDYIRKQTLVGSERYITPELKEYEEKVLGAEEKILELEKELFLELRRWVGQRAERIQEVAAVIARLDTLWSLAEVAHRNGYVRPQLEDSQELYIREGRHPVLELQQGEPFVPNDLFCNTESDQLLVLTGPNMGGKSTFLRQNALIVILAQMGSFVPAAEARVGLVDRIFTRVGASDNLARGRSTFMVEMIETARILNTATSRSFVLLDEVGRGTATFDGLSIAWAVAEHLLTRPQGRPRTLFATHYQELTRLEKLYSGAKNYYVTVHESGGEILFFHRVAPGVASKSYGIEVARLAGLPPPVVQRAREILSRLERKELNLLGTSRTSPPREEVWEELQKTLF